MEESLKESRECILETIVALDAVLSPERVNSGEPLTEDECNCILFAQHDFERAFEREVRRLQVFTVTAKGTRDTVLLIEKPESDLPARAIPFLPPQFLYDLRQSARCLAFDIPTACAFHACRATESLMLAYYRLLTKHDWNFKRRDWNIYVEQLAVEGAPKRMTTRLDEIRAMDRNTYTHPDENVSLDEAKVLYTLCVGVNYFIAEEMVKLQP